MITQVIFTMDKNLKYKAMKKARSFGLPFSSVLNITTQAFVDGKINIGVTQTETLNTKTRRELIKISKDIKGGKNLSPVFRTAQEMDHYLNSL
jgi:antitoxin component of RelBE/YafQ-DinJ toxin-antitoxin module